MSKHLKTRSHRATAVGALAAATVLLLAGPASAHVTVQPSSAPADATDQSFSFRVPDEQDNANTVKVEVDFPTDHPIPSVSLATVPGWTDEIKTTKLATPIHTDDGDITDVVSQVVWTGGQITPGHYQDFAIAIGQLPTGTDQVVFKALQTYNNGQIVRWIDVPKDGQPEPEHPAPTLHLSAAAAGTPSAGAKASAPASPSTAAAKSSSSDSTARTLGIVGIVVGIAGALIGVLGRRRGAASSGK